MVYFFRHELYVLLIQKSHVQSLHETIPAKKTEVFIYLKFNVGHKGGCSLRRWPDPLGLLAGVRRLDEVRSERFAEANDRSILVTFQDPTSDARRVPIDAKLHPYQEQFGSQRRFPVQLGGYIRHVEAGHSVHLQAHHRHIRLRIARHVGAQLASEGQLVGGHLEVGLRAYLHLVFHILGDAQAGRASGRGQAGVRRSSGRGQAKLRQRSEGGRAEIG